MAFRRAPKNIAARLGHGLGDLQSTTNEVPTFAFQGSHLTPPQAGVGQQQFNNCSPIATLLNQSSHLGAPKPSRTSSTTAQSAKLTLQNIETGRLTNVSVSQLLNIAFALKVAPSLLLAPLGRPTDKIDLPNLSSGLAAMTTVEFDAWLTGANTGGYRPTNAAELALPPLRRLDVKRLERTRQLGPDRRQRARILRPIAATRQREIVAALALAADRSGVEEVRFWWAKLHPPGIDATQTA